MIVTPQDMRKRYDSRTLLRLSVDDEAIYTLESLDVNPILLTAIEEAEAEVFAALSVAQMYTKEQLNHLTEESLQLYKRIVCELALCFLYMRRGAESRESVKDMRTVAEEYLDRLRKGERLFSIEGSDVKEKAGHGTLVAPTAVHLQNLNGITQRASVYFGGIAQRLHTRPYGGNE